MNREWGAQARFASDYGITRQTVSRWTKNRVPSGEWLLLIMREFNLKIEDLLDVEEDKKNAPEVPGAKS